MRATVIERLGLFILPLVLAANVELAAGAEFPTEGAVAVAEVCPVADCETHLPSAAKHGKIQSAAARKIASVLAERASTVRAHVLRGATASELEALSDGAARVNDAAEIQVYVILEHFDPRLVTQLEAIGLRVEIALPAYRLVQGWLAVAVLDVITGFDFVREIRLPGYPDRNVGSVTTAGDGILRASNARSFFGVAGAGVKVGVISDGVDHLADSVASADLPPGVQVLQNPGGAEGTAMLEIVHDIAPAATLAFYGPTTSADMVNAINALLAAGSRIVVDDLRFLDEPKFQDGMIAQTARAFATAGRVYVTAAGNYAERHYRAPYSRTPGNATYAFVHNYVGAPSVDVGNTLIIPNGCNVRVVLQWNNPNGASADDLDLFLLRSSDGAVLAGSTSLQTGTQNAFEFFSYTNTTGVAQTAYIAVAEFSLVSFPASVILDYVVFHRCGLTLQYVTAADSVAGHSAVSEVLSVAALNASSPTTAASYSSRGPASISFPFQQSRALPNISGIDCVQTQVGLFGFFANPFCGTSAAAPHVAGLAALVIQRFPSLSSPQIHALLTGGAIDLGTLGFDFTHGFGRADGLNSAATFADVRADAFAWQWIEALYRSGVTGGCSSFLPLLYCPDSPVTREQMAVFLLRAGEAPGFTPPPCLVATFVDVPCGGPFAPWIYELSRRGITAGCSVGLYCPTAPVTREQMAVFLLRASGDGPIACSGTFSDVGCSSPFAGWIQRLVQRGITAGCAPGLYCPLNSVTRAQMAIFLVKTFDLPL